MPFFALKYLTRYTHETFFEEYINFKIFRNLSHCGVIPVRNFGSHIRPQPHGLGLTMGSGFTSCLAAQAYQYGHIYNCHMYMNFLVTLK
jgi:hypothetical protein